MASVTISRVQKLYGSVAVLKGIDMAVEDGEFVVLVGPSGCGKSTLLRMIAGLEGISGGQISIGDKVVNDLEPKERDIAMVFQNYALYPHMSVAENMGFALKLSGVPKDEINSKVDRAAGILGLEALLDRFPRQLSGGQRQRVAMGRAIVRNPQVFLFDEPLSNLDAKLRVQMRSEIKELHQRLQTTMVYVTHDQIEAMTMADKIVVMRDGVIEQVGAPLDIYDKPVNRFVAGFIGSPAMNFIEGKMSDKGFETTGGLVLPVPANVPGAVTYGIRPESLQIDASGMEAEILLLEPTGAETQFTVNLSGQPIIGLARERLSLRYGDRIGIKPDTTAVHLFDTNGNRLAGRPVCMSVGVGA